MAAAPSDIEPALVHARVVRKGWRVLHDGTWRRVWSHKTDHKQVVTIHFGPDDEALVIPAGQLVYVHPDHLNYLSIFDRRT